MLGQTDHDVYFENALLMARLEGFSDDLIVLGVLFGLQIKHRQSAQAKNRLVGLRAQVGQKAPLGHDIVLQLKIAESQDELEQRKVATIESECQEEGVMGHAEVSFVEGQAPFREQKGQAGMIGLFDVL